MKLVKNTLDFIQEMPLWDMKESKWIKFILWPRQVEFLDLLHSVNFISFLKRRQIGGSQLVGADSIAQCMIQDNFVVLILSRSGPDAIEFLKRSKKMHDGLPLDMKLASPLKRDTTEELEWDNGSRLISLPVNRGEGFTGHRVIIDEAARITKRESKTTLDLVLNNVEPVIRRAKGQLILISKASGYNLFHNYYLKGKDKQTSWKSFFFSCWDDPEFTKEERDQIVIDYGENHANENYPRDDVEAFIMSGRCVFSRTMMKKFLQRIQNFENPKKGYLERVDDRVFFRFDEEGWVEIFEDPIPGVSYVLGSDVAEGIERPGIAEDDQKTDFSALGVWRKEADKYIQVARIRVRLNPKLWTEEVYRMGLFYNYAFIAVERNKDGFGVLLDLKDKYNYTNLFYQETYDPDVEVRKEKLGFTTDKISRPAMIRTAGDLIRNDKVIFRSKETLSEFMTFVKDADGKCAAQDGCHDDECMASMIVFEVFPKAPKVAKKDSYRKGYKKSEQFEKEMAKIPPGY